VQVVRDSWRRLLPEKWRAITEEFAKFGTIGLINLIVNFTVFNLLWLTILRTGEVKAKAIATIVATTCAYFMNRHWTYRDRPKSTLRREYSLFFVFNLVGLIIEVTVVFIAKYGFHQTHIVVLNLVTAVGIVLGTIFRFWAYRTHVFKRELNTTVAAEAAIAGPIAFLDDGDDESDELDDVDDLGLDNADERVGAGAFTPTTVSAAGGGATRSTEVDEARLSTGLDDVDMSTDVDDVEIELDGMVALAEEPARPNR
jgi:putative flippase GtrA